jgi:hypothetical protein
MDWLMLIAGAVFAELLAIPSQYARKPARRQRSTVSGLRIFSASNPWGRSDRARQTAVDRCCRTAARFGDLRLSTLS